MSVAGALRRDVTRSATLADTRRAPVTAARVACATAIVLAVTAPFESLAPLLRVPGQSLTTTEAILLAVCAACAVAALRARAWPMPAPADAVAWTMLLAAAGLSAARAEDFRLNAAHMTARIAAAGVIWAVCVAGGHSMSGRRRIVAGAVASGTIVAALVIADFAAVPLVGRFLDLFRSGVAVVGAQVRASGPFQYPTIASMFLEIALALGLGLLVSLQDASGVLRIGMVVALAMMVEGIVLTFTRSGLITVVMSMLVVGVAHWRRAGFDRGVAAIVVLAFVGAGGLLSSRSAETLMLRLTSEGQGRWFSAAVDAPESLSLDTRLPLEVPITIVNTGRATWDSDAAERVRLSYHWIAEDSDEVVAWEGYRTAFSHPVRSGEKLTMLAKIGGPGRPGRFRLMWDVEQENRLWFSTEPDALIAFTEADVTGAVTSMAISSGPRRVPRMAVRPGRVVLWRAAWRMFLAHPLLGVGPDNYRLLYGRYSKLAAADPRVHSNNMYVEVLAGSGLVGACAFFWLAARTARAAWVAMRRSDLGAGMAAAIAAIAVHGLADSFLSFTGTYTLIALVLGLVSASARTPVHHAHRV